MIPEQEREQLLSVFNSTVVEFPSAQTVLSLFEEQVKQNPRHVAVVFEGKELTYEALDDRSNQLARYLQASGLQPEELVGLFLDRSLEMMVGILGILKSGGAYVPIDPAYPTDRIDYILADAGIKKILSEQESADKLPAREELEVILLDNHWEMIGKQSPKRLSVSPATENLAYVIYTSGSTGRPKGVMIEHGAILNRIQWMQHTYGLRADDRVLQKTPFSFDVSVWELLWPIAYGAQLVFASPGKHIDPYYLRDIIAEEQITYIHFVPSMLKAFLSIDQLEQKCTALKTVICSGEALGVKLKNEFFDIFNQVQLHNLYGPTEAAIDVTYWPCQKESEIVPIGKPIANIQIYILDPENRPLPIGATGELSIGGVGLARGYVNQPELTHQKFVPNPFKPGQRIYKTGDLARWLPDGNIVFQGRMDDQVKIRGFRIELGEIEAVLAQQIGVKDCCVSAWESPDGSKHLVGYVIVEGKLESQRLESALSLSLPDYMVPRLWVSMEALPLSNNGKVAKQLLPDPSFDSGVSFVAPEGELEAGLADLWSQILGAEKIGRADSFFTLGGSSLKVVQLIARIYKQYEVKLNIKDIFTHPQLSDQAKLIGQANHTAYQPIKMVVERRSHILSPSQLRLWIMSQITPEQTAFNISKAIRFAGELDHDRLNSAFNKLIQRHEILRASFELDEQSVVQYISKKVDLEIVKYNSGENEVSAIIDEFIKPFDLSQNSLIRVGLIEINSTNHVLIVDIHNIISDEISINILIKELMRLYNGERLVNGDLQYQDYLGLTYSTELQEEIKRKKDFWLEEFADEIPRLQLPLDFPRPTLRKFEGGIESIVFGHKEYQKLKAICAETKVDMSTMTLAIFSILLAKLGKTEDLVIGTPTTGRTLPDRKNMIGLLANTICIRNYPKADLSFKDYLTQLKSTVDACHENASYPYEQLMDDLDAAYNTGRNPIFDVMFSYVKSELLEITTPGLKATACDNKIVRKASKCDLSLIVEEKNDCLQLKLEYATELFNKARIKTFINYLERIVSLITTDPGRKLATIDFLSPDEKDLLLLIENSNIETVSLSDPIITNENNEHLPKTLLETKLQGIWSNVLNLETEQSV